MPKRTPEDGKCNRCSATETPRWINDAEEVGKSVCASCYTYHRRKGNFK